MVPTTLTAVSDTGESPTAPSLERLRQPLGRRGPWFAAVWLFFLVDPLLVAWHHRDTFAGIAGFVLTLAFGACYMLVFASVRRLRSSLSVRPPASTSVLWLLVLILLAALMCVTLGQVGTTASVYLAVAGVMLLPFRWAFALALVIAVLVVVLGETVSGWDRSLDLAFALLAATFAMYGVTMMMRRNVDLIAAHEENSALLVEHERTRLARDLHDILGHSLTVITVKAELAGRLLDAESPDLARARAEVGDLERLARDALADVRRTVEGYRELTLPGELARARVALEAAEIQAELPNSTEEVPSDLRELFAWTVREGVTNVIRHSRATSCRIVISPEAIEVVDDGQGPPPDHEPGSGLRGLRERAARVGATVVTRALSPGFSLSVVRGSVGRVVEG